MSFLWVGGRRVYFGWNLKHEVLCGCLNTPWHVVWEKGWARGGAELCGCRKQSSPAAGNSFGGTPPGKYLTAEKPSQCYVLYSENSVWSFCGLHPAFLYVSWQVSKKIPEILCSTAHSQQRPAGAVTGHAAVGEEVPEPFPWLWRGYSASCSSCFPLGRQQQVLRILCTAPSWTRPKEGGSCIALRASKPLCTAERLRKSPGTSCHHPALPPSLL